MSLFDPRPKSSLRDFFDREGELREFVESVKASPLTLVLGLRRYGKTSLILTGLSMDRIKYIYLDCRALPSGMIGVSDLALLLAQGINDFVRRCGSLSSVLHRVFEGVEGVSISALGLTINVRRLRNTGLVELISRLGDLGGKVILVIDEAQELRRIARYRFDSLLAYVYDNLSNVGVVLSGSEVGLLYRLLRVDDPDAPLYGRPYSKVVLRKLSRELSVNFLKSGFREHGLKVPDELINYIVSSVDGVIGWLTYVGFKVVTGGKASKEVVDDALNEAGRLSLRELQHFLSMRYLAKERYLSIMRAVAVLGRASWSNIYGYVQAKAGKTPKTTFNTLLKNLLDAGFIEKEDGQYVISDPILRKALLV